MLSQYGVRRASSAAPIPKCLSLAARNGALRRKRCRVGGLGSAAVQGGFAAQGLLAARFPSLRCHKREEYQRQSGRRTMPKGCLRSYRAKDGVLKIHAGALQLVSGMCVLRQLDGSELLHLERMGRRRRVGAGQQAGPVFSVDRPKAQLMRCWLRRKFTSAENHCPWLPGSLLWMSVSLFPVPKLTQPDGSDVTGAEISPVLHPTLLQERGCGVVPEPRLRAHIGGRSHARSRPGVRSKAVPPDRGRTFQIAALPVLQLPL